MACEVRSFAGELNREKSFMASIGKLEQEDVSIENSELIQIENDRLQEVSKHPKEFKRRECSSQDQTDLVQCRDCWRGRFRKCDLLQMEEKCDQGIKIRVFVSYVVPCS